MSLPPSVSFHCGGGDDAHSSRDDDDDRSGGRDLGENLPPPQNYISLKYPKCNASSV